MKQPIIRPIPGSKDRCELVEAYDFEYKNEIHTIPAGFKFDGASIPRALWSVVGHPFSPRFVAAALIHDYHWVIEEDWRDRDNHFKKVLRLNGVGRFKSNLMWKAVRAYSRTYELFN